MVTCSKCNKQLNNPTYLVRQLGYLCGECARDHANEEIMELQDKIDSLQTQITEIRSKVTLALQNDCEHEFVISGYGCIGIDGDYQSLEYCDKCNLIKYVKF